MQERTIDIATPDGAMNSYVFHPDAPGPHPVVLFYMDALGVREELSDMCRRIASVGYYVLMPNLYYRSLRAIDIDGKRMLDPAYAGQVELMWKCNRALTNAMVERDTQAMIDFVDGEASARAGKLGCVGYCMSGRFVFRAASQFPERVAASASVYGAGLVTDRTDSPHLHAKEIAGEMAFLCAEHDHYVPAKVLDALRTLIDETGIDASIEIFPETDHGFAFPQRPVYRKRAAETHWERLFALFARRL